MLVAICANGSRQKTCSHWPKARAEVGAAAILDRLIHSSVKLTLKGESMLNNGL
jgi:hypothetical protein